MRPVDVLLLIEHADRELDAVSCISSILQTEYGLNCVVANFYADMVPLSRYQPRVVGVPFFYFLDHAPMRNYVARWPEARIVNFAWEQILYKMNLDIKVPKDEFARTRVTHLCWTRTFQDIIVSMGIPEDHTVLCGNPVMKFYDEPYRRYFKSRADLATRYGLDPDRRWLLFPENYRWGFLSERQISAFAKQGGNPEYIRGAHEFCKRSLSEVFQWFAALDRADDPLVILRPRPATGLSEIRAFGEAALGELPRNLRLIKDETAREWILAADTVMSSYSTTLIEAALAGKPVHVLAPEPFPEALGDSWYDLVETITTPGRFTEAARTEPNPGNSKALCAWTREQFLGAGDPLRAMAETLAARAGARRTATRSRIAPLSPWDAVRGHAWNAVVRRPQAHRLIKLVEPEFSFTCAKHEKDVFHAGDVHRRASRWDELLRHSDP